MESSLPNNFDPAHHASLQLPPSMRSGGELTQLYQRALRQNQLLGASCQKCQHTHFPPKSRCPRCDAFHLLPLHLSGRGQLYAAEISQNPGELSLGRILLEEGFWVRALLVGDFRDPARLSAPMHDGAIDVIARVLCTQGVAILAFQPA